jgi:hypothetical protein
LIAHRSTNIQNINELSADIKTVADFPISTNDEFTKKHEKTNNKFA